MCFYLAAAGEALVVGGRPAGAVGVVLVLEEAGVRVFLQLLRVLHEQVVELGLLRRPPGPELAVVLHVDLERRGESEGQTSPDAFQPPSASAAGDRVYTF